MRNKLIAGVLVASALGAPGAWAAFEDLGAGARAPGMGNAFVAVADDVYAIHYNPAGLGALDRPQFGASYNKLNLGLSDNSDLSTAFVGYLHPVGEGRHGTAGTAWNGFSLNNTLYREDSFYLSYGRKVLEGLYGGLSVKYLRSAYGNLGEASNAFNGIGLTGQPDPLLRNKVRGVLDADVGGLYRIGRHYTVGLMLAHVNQPNVAFNPGFKDKLPLSVKAGINYHSLISNLGFQVDALRSSAGTQDKVFTIASERWFPRTFVGDFGVRGSFAIGNRDFKQLSIGASYRTRRLQADYAFIIPINTVAGTYGTHRVAFTFRFGRASDEEESLELVLDAMRQLKAGAAVALSPSTLGLSKEARAQVEEFLAQARSLELSAEYKASAEKIVSAMALAPADANIVARFTRLNFTASHYPSLPLHKTDPVQGTLHQGVLSYLANRNLEAVQKVSEALAFRPADVELDRFLADMERQTGFKRSKVLAPARPERYALAAAMTRADAAIQEGRYQEAIDLSLDVLREDDKLVAAWQNLGTAYFALKDLDSSLRAWRRVYELEKSPAVREEIRRYIQAIERAQKAAKEKAARIQAQPRPERPRLTDQEIQALYNEGVDHFTRRDFEKAKAAFEKILEADPTNIEAQKALKRVLQEIR